MTYLRRGGEVHRGTPEVAWEKKPLGDERTKRNGWKETGLMTLNLEELE